MYPMSQRCTLFGKYLNLTHIQWLFINQIFEYRSYSLLCEGVDEIVDEMNSIKVNLNLPITLYEEILPAPDECKLLISIEFDDYLNCMTCS